MDLTQEGKNAMKQRAGTETNALSPGDILDRDYSTLQWEGRGEGSGGNNQVWQGGRRWGRENLLEAVRWWRRGKEGDLDHQRYCGLCTLLCFFETHQLSDTTPGLMR